MSTKSSTVAMYVVSLFIGVCSGVVWGLSSVGYLAFASIPPLFWIISNSRRASFLCILSYYLVASRDLPEASATFFGQEYPEYFGWILWGTVAILSSMIWYVLWSPSRRIRTLKLPIAFVVSIIPPVGFISWMSPLLSAAVFFPGCGIIGIILLVALYLKFGFREYRQCAFLCLVSILLNATYSRNNIPLDGWIAQNTQYGKLASNAFLEDGMDTTKRLTDLRMQARSLQPGDVMVFPETMLGSVDDIIADQIDEISIWMKSRNVGAIAGAEIPRNSSGTSYDNVVAGLGALSGIFVKQRVPVPISMWKPLTGTGATLNWKDDGIVNVKNKRIGIIICYEILLFWPEVLTSIKSPDMLVGVINAWWSRNTNIPDIEIQSMNAWGRLLNIPVIISINK